MGMTIMAVIFGVVAIGLGIFCFVNENFIKDKADDAETEVPAKKNAKK